MSSFDDDLVLNGDILKMIGDVTGVEIEEENEMDHKTLHNLLANHRGVCDDDEEEDSEFKDVVVGEEEFKIKLICNEEIPSTLFAQYIWPASKVLSSHLLELDLPSSVLELGAGCGLPSMVMCRRGVGRVLVTDFPHPILLDEIEQNLARNCPYKDNVQITGLLWGEEMGEKVDMVIASEVLWLHDQHENLLKTISSSLNPLGTCLIAFSHHIPTLEEKDLHFFHLAREGGEFESVGEVLREEVVHPFSSHKTTTIFLFSMTKK